MRRIRTKLLITILALSGTLALAIPIQGNGVHAATGGTSSTFSVDQTITSTSSSVTTSQAFPDGTTTAQCLIMATTKSGPQTTTYGNCAGLTLNITCASGTIPSGTPNTPPDKGAAVTINGTASWTGVYDNGATCTTGTKVAGSNPTLTADVSGLTAGQKVVFFVNTDAGNGFNSPNGRNGCWQYFEGGSGTPEKCIQLGQQPNGNGPGGAFYEITAGAASGTIQQSLGTQLNNNGNMTLGGVFINTSGAAAATSTPAAGGTATATAAAGGTATATATAAAGSTATATAAATATATAAAAGTATATPAPTTVPTAGPLLPAALNQFGTDFTLTSTSSGVTSSQAFPDGSTAATCFVGINSKSGVQSTTFGNCAGYSVNVTCSSFQFSSNPTTDQHGAAYISGTTRTQAGAYDTGPSCTTVPNATLTYDVTGLTAGTRLVFWWNNDSSPSRNGCVSYKDSTGQARPGCFVNSASSQNGTFYETFAGAATGTAYEFKGAANQIGNSGNVTAGGVFIGCTGCAPLSATAVHVQRIHGVNHLRWFSALKVRGYNVFNAKTKLNRHLVTSKTQWYTFATRHAVNKVRLVPVQ